MTMRLAAVVPSVLLPFGCQLSSEISPQALLESGSTAASDATEERVVAPACADEEVLSSGDATLTLVSDPVVGFALRGIEQGGIGGFDMVAGAALWALEVNAVEDLTVVQTLGPADATSSSCLRSSDGSGTDLIELGWTSLTTSSGDVYDVLVAVSANPSEGVFRFDAEVVYQGGPGLDAVSRLDVPRVELSDLGVDSELYKGFGPGLRFVDPLTSAMHHTTGEPLRRDYPFYQLLPFDGYADPTVQRGLVTFLAAVEPDDRRYGLKSFEAGSTSNVAQGAEAAIRMAIGHHAEGMDQVRSWSAPDQSVLGILPCSHPQSCWWDLADWYRGHVEASGRMERGKLHELPAAEQQLLAYDLASLLGWHDQSGTAQPDWQSYVDYLDVVNTELGLQPEEHPSIWYDWHHNDFDRDLPAHLPAKAGFADAVQTVVARGHMVAPYTTPVVWETSLPSYADLAVADGVIVERDGSLRISASSDEVPHSHAQLDPASTHTRDNLVSFLYEGTIASTSTSGMYLDAYPSATPCYAADHGHPVGGGNSYAQGVRTLVDRIATLQAGVGEPAFVLNEAATEYLFDKTAGANWYRGLDFFDLAATAERGHVPMLDVVYRDTVQMVTPSFDDSPANPLYAPEDDQALAQALDQLYLSAGWAFSMGHAPVLFRRPNPDPTGPQRVEDIGSFAPFVAYWKETVVIRRHPQLRDALLFGRMGPPPLVVEDGGSLRFDNPIMPFSNAQAPGVFAAVFVSPTGDVALTLTNWRDEPVRYAGYLEPSLYGMEVDEEGTLLDVWRVSAIDADENVVLTENLNDNPALLFPDFDVPPRQAGVVLYERQ